MSEWDAKTAEWYAENYGEYATNRLAVNDLELPVDATIVDIGCGTGAALREASVKVTAGSLMGIDPVPRMVAIANERLAGHPAAARIEFRVGSAEEIPVETDMADFVFAFDSVDHWQDRARGFREVARIMKPQGRLVMVKDGDVPDAARKAAALDTEIQAAGFKVVVRRNIEVENIKFTLWVCMLSS